MNIVKGFSIGFICLALGGFLGHKLTNMYFEKASHMFFVGMEAGKKSVIQKK
jgi:hypothetical protein